MYLFDKFMQNGSCSSEVSLFLRLHTPCGDTVHLTTVSIIHGARPRPGLPVSPSVATSHLGPTDPPIRPSPCPLQ